MNLLFLIVLLYSQAVFAIVDCGVVEPILNISQKECDVCSNREFGTYFDHYGRTKTFCSLKNCPEGYIKSYSFFYPFDITKKQLQHFFILMGEKK